MPEGDTIWRTAAGLRERLAGREVAAGVESVTFSGRLGPDPTWAIDALGDVVEGAG